MTREEIINMVKPSIFGENEGVVFIPEYSEYIRITAGEGDNLSKEDLKNGYIDYACFDVFKGVFMNGDPEIVSDDLINCTGESAELLLKDTYVNHYDGRFADAIADAIDMCYGAENVHFVCFVPEPSKFEIKRYEKKLLGPLAFLAL